MRRAIDSELRNHFATYKQAMILLGARQVGKTTLLRRLFPHALYLLVDEEPIRSALETYSMQVYKQLIGNAQQIIIDEIHLLSNPGRAVKILHDNDASLQIMVTGSSSLHIRNTTSESMAGRSIFYHLYPLSYGEYLYQTGAEKKMTNTIFDKIRTQDTRESIKRYDSTSLLENVLLYGLYPNILSLPRDTKYLRNLAATAVFKDITELHLIDNKTKAQELLRILAYQIGNLINYNELSNKLGISANTVKRYVDIFEQSFLIYRLPPFTKNRRDEIGKAAKIYFWDLGLRNAIINNFDKPDVRPDAGAIFENFVVSEVKKAIAYTNSNYTVHYWRLKSGSEVDMVLQNNREIIGCEIKLHGGKLSRAFSNRYPEAKTHVVTAHNLL